MKARSEGMHMLKRFPLQIYNLNIQMELKTMSKGQIEADHATERHKELGKYVVEMLCI